MASAIWTSWSTRGSRSGDLSGRDREFKHPGFPTSLYRSRRGLCRSAIITQETKATIAEAVARDAGVTKTRAGHCVDVIVAVLMESLAGMGRIEIRGLGVFIVRARKRGIGRNPRTGKTVPVPPGFTVRFKHGKVLRSLPLGERRR